MALVNEEQLARVVAFLKANPPKSHGMNFYDVPDGKGGRIVLDTMYPEIDHPQAIDFFFFACLHQYGFWYGDDKGYVEPMIAMVLNPRKSPFPKEVKGSDLLWMLLKRELDENPDFFRPEQLAQVSRRDLAHVLMSDAETPWPDFEERFALTRRYGRWLLEANRTPSGIVQLANTSDEPWRLARFLEVFDRHTSRSPFASDGLRKKQVLLAMILANRPERFLKVSSDTQWPPIVDYHLMRTVLRLGLVDISDSVLQMEAIPARAWIHPDDEADVRSKTAEAVMLLVHDTGLPMSTIDEMLWMARKYCPEMTQPDCEKCVFTTICAKKTELFQPVLRTTAY